MATPSVISYPQFSFFKPDYSPSVECTTIERECLPMYLFSDVKFQIQVGELGDLDEPVRVRKVYGVIAKGDCETPPDIYPNEWDGQENAINGEVIELETNTNFEALFYFTGNGEINWNTYNGYLEDPIEVGDCFRIFFIEEYRNALDESILYDRYVMGCSPCIERIEDTCFTSVVTYSCTENSYGFVYSDNGTSTSTPNEVRLSVYLKEPQIKSEQDSFRLSNQSYIKLFQVDREEWILETPRFDYETHRKLEAALGHDNLIVDNDNMNQQAPRLGVNFVFDGDYSIAWGNKPQNQYGKANLKLTVANAINMRNLNCG